MKKGDASMVATVLLVMTAIVAGIMVTSFSQKSTKKVSEKIVEIGTSVDCNDIRLSLSYENNNLKIKNRGTLGIDQIKLRIFSGDTVTTEDIDKDNFPKDKLFPNEEYVFTNIISFDMVEAKPIFINKEGDLIGCNAATYTQ